ncbi:MAG: sigma 54-interacting transcriptional regulator [Winogradskyella sp.]|uniref:sigma 54-interacting transcriptional regulator n=1 Tax=Winogradskyella sp. TaxID=1883156 RepID=UPI0017E42E37|nr:sigma 54-interacting transcriptional regulator [Winogradskyella sp.]
MKSNKGDHIEKSSQTVFAQNSPYAKIFHNNPTPHTLSNKKDRKLVDVNESWEKFTGYKRKDVVGKTVEELKLISFKEADSIREVLTEKQVFKSHEIEVLRKDGLKTYGLATFQFIQLQGSAYVQSSILDISALKNTENELYITKNFSDRLLDSMYEGLIVLDANLTCIRVNKAYTELTGFKESDIVGTKQPFPHWPPEQYEKFRKYVKLGLDGVFDRDQLIFKKANGDRFEVAAASAKITNHKNEIIGYVSTIIDISERIKYQNELKEKSEKAEVNRDAIIKLVNLIGSDFDDILKTITSTSSNVLEVARVSLWKFNEDETAIHCINAYNLETNKFVDTLTLHSENYPSYFKALYKRKTLKIDDVYHNRITKELASDYLSDFGITSMLDVFISGVEKPFGVICFEQIGEKRKWTSAEEQFATTIASIVSLAVENNQRKKVETNLILEKEFSEELLNSLQEGLSVVNPKGESIRVNKALCEMTGFTEEELVGSKPPFKYWPPEDHDKFFNVFKQRDHWGKNIKEFWYMTKTGTRFPVSLALSSVKNNDGETIAYFTTINDITKRKSEAKALREAARLSKQRKDAISTMVTLIGQDYNTVIKKITQLASKALNINTIIIWKFNDDQSRIHGNLFFDTDKTTQIDNDLVLSETEMPDYFKALKSNSLLSIPNIKEDPRTIKYAKALKALNVNGCKLDAAIFSKNRRYGILSFECAVQDRVFTSEEENFAASVATIISLMIETRERTKAENNLLESNEKLIQVNKELTDLKRELEKQNVYLKEELDLAFNYEEMVYGSAAFSDVLTDIETVAVTDATVLLLGESGTGKELLARAIHNISNRKDKPLIKVNCAAIPKELIESELFGHTKGSFTGAFSDKDGKFKLADGGTLFLDEIGELPIDMQPKLLRAIQEGEIESIGSTKTEKVDIRIITATNRDLKAEIDKNNFREDLYFRINVFPVTVPPLRERTEDIPILIEHFVNRFGKKYNKTIKFIPQDTKLALQNYHWPGNIRELENLIERAVILSNAETLFVPGFVSDSKETSISKSVLSLNDVQRLHIEKILSQCNWKIEGDNGASQLLQIKPSTLRDRIKKLGIKKS